MVRTTQKERRSGWTDLMNQDQLGVSIGTLRAPSAWSRSRSDQVGSQLRRNQVGVDTYDMIIGVKGGEDEDSGGRSPPDPSGCLDSVDPRHTDVHQDHVGACAHRPVALSDRHLLPRRRWICHRFPPNEVEVPEPALTKAATSRTCSKDVDLARWLVARSPVVVWQLLPGDGINQMSSMPSPSARFPE